MAQEKHVLKTEGKAPVEHTGIQKWAEKQDGERPCYYDGMGKRLGRKESVREQWAEKSDFESKFSDVNENLQNGYRIDDAIKAALDTDRVSMPVFVLEDIFISDDENHPLVNGLAREAVSTNEVKIDEVTDVVEADPFLEGEAVTAKDDTFEKYQYDVMQVGIEKEVTDKLIASGRYDATEVKAETASRGIDRYLERQAVRGTDYNTAANGGFEGLRDWVDESREYDGSASGDDLSGETELSPKIMGRLRTDLTKRGTNVGDIMMLCSHEQFELFKRTHIDEIQRYSNPAEEFSFGLQSLKFDGVMISVSHGVETNEALALDAAHTFWVVLQETEIEPLSKNSTKERFMATKYCSLASESQTRISRAYNIGDTAA